jgi:centromeric protein E
VDLAGSESVKLSGSSDRRTEGHYINKSLMTLGQVVYALSEETGKKSHVPYRDSKLTRLLQPSLSGNAQVVLVCCISPLVTHVEESHNTFKFATRAKKIPQKATVQESMDEKTLLESYREEIETLRLQLKEAKEQQERQDAKAQLSSHSTLSTTSTTEEMDEDEIIELAEAIQTRRSLF